VRPDRYGRAMHRTAGRHLYAIDFALALALTVVYVGFSGMTAADGQPATRWCEGVCWSVSRLSV
jgi:hypothetical protein